MSTALSIYHGSFGRASLYRLDRPLTKHAHREGHLMFHVRGTPACVDVVDDACLIAPGHAVAINPWQLHNFRPADPHEGQLCLVLYIRPMWFLDFSRSTLVFGSPQLEVGQRLDSMVTRVVALMLDGFATDRFDGCLYELTEECFALSHGRGAARATDGQRADTAFGDARVRKSIELMSENVGAGLDTDEIARISGLSRPHFFKLFRRHTGLTPHLFLNTLRMEKAIEWLAETDQSVSEIGFDLGFSSQSSFTRFFSSNVGMAPTSYRRVAHLLQT